MLYYINKPHEINLKHTKTMCTRPDVPAGNRPTFNMIFKWFKNLDKTQVDKGGAYIIIYVNKSVLVVSWCECELCECVCAVVCK